jgi:hypothetical protein
LHHAAWQALNFKERQFLNKDLNPCGACIHKRQNAAGRFIQPFADAGFAEG